MNAHTQPQAQPQARASQDTHPRVRLDADLAGCQRDDPAEHAIYGIMNAPLCTYPYAHMFLHDLFPADLYTEMLEHLPDDHAYRPADTGRYPERGRLMLAGESGDDLDRLCGQNHSFWTHFKDEILTDSLWGALVERFVPTIASRMKEICWLHAFLGRDRGGYAISPHTDTSRKLLSVLVYLPNNSELSDCGTSIVVSDRPEHNVFDVPHSGRWDGFRVAKTVPFAMNSMFAFLVSDTSLHAVRPTPPGTVRNTLQFSIMMPSG